jgi:hypothetical protein
VFPSIVLCICLFLVWIGAASAAPAEEPFRPPAVPLVTCDPYFSIWSFTDRLTDSWPRHWTGRTQAMCSMVRVDGEYWGLMGSQPDAVEPMPQISLDVLPTRTVYMFSGDEVQVKLTFMTPLLPADLDVLARPVTYLEWEVSSADGRPHEVSLYLDITAEAAVNEPSQEVEWRREQVPGLEAVRIGTTEQPVLAKKGDNLRIDWGYLYMALPHRFGALAYAGGCGQVRDPFAEGQDFPEADDARMPRAANDDWPVLACRMDLGAVRRTVRRHALLAYDDLYSVEYFRQHLRPYWRRNGAEAADLLQQAAKEFPALRRRCEAFDRQLMADLESAGGLPYARVCALAYRQAVAGNKLAADPAGMPVLFPKECFSNGCIGTVDVIYPMQPLFLLLSPALVKASLAPVLEYASSPRWPWPFAPHDLGTYPQANGQVYGGGEKGEQNQMPVEECGNMLIMLAALAHAEGNAEFAGRYWPVVTQWAEYLEEKGLDPENQLCTDDFAGHLAHNVNLSAKAIIGLAGYGPLCEMRGEGETGRRYRELARSWAAQWVEMADDGDHFRLAFDRPDTWSQKYNLVWDRILGLGLFPPDVTRKEMAFYRQDVNPYGLPLDVREDYTKLDWAVWTATLTGDRADFDALFAPLYRYVNETPSRVPLSDWYFTTTGEKRGFQARPVVGGVFIKLLYEKGVWRKWVRRAESVDSG